jgi:putative FmdB family regulatory protein
MPIHEFKCKGCGNIFEYLCLRSDDKDHVVCPSCGRGETEVVLSAFTSMGSMPRREVMGMPSAYCRSSRGFS